MSRKIVEQAIRSIIRNQGWRIRKSHKNDTSKYLYLEKKVQIVIRISDHKTRRTDVFSVDSEDGSFESFWKEKKQQLTDLLQNPFSQRTTRKSRRGRAPNDYRSSN